MRHLPKVPDFTDFSPHHCHNLLSTDTRSKYSRNMMECIKMVDTKLLMLIKLLYIVCILKSAISLEDHQSLSFTRNLTTCPHCYQPLHQDNNQNVSYRSNHQMSPNLSNINGNSPTQLVAISTNTNPPTDSQLTDVGLNETNSRSIYASLMKILQQLKDQMRNSSQDLSDSSEFTIAETINSPVTVDQLKRLDHDWSLKNGVVKEKRFNRDTTKLSSGKRQSRYDSLPPVTFVSAGDASQQEPLTTKNSQANINFDDNMSNGNSMKKTSYSKYLGPTIDVMTTKLRSDRKLNQQQSMDNNWYPNDEYSPSLRPYDDSVSTKNELLLDSTTPIFTTPGPDYPSSTSATPPINDYPNIHHPFRTPYSFPPPDIKPTSDQGSRDTPNDHNEPTILLVRKQRHNGLHKKTRSTSHHKSSASHRESIHAAHVPAGFDTNSLFEHDDPEAAQTIKSSTNFGELGEEMFRPKLNQPIYLQQLDSRPTTAHSSNQYLGQYLQLQPSASQKVYYTLTTIPQGSPIKSIPASASNLRNVLGTGSQRDLLNQPQTIQITSVPSNGLNNPGALVRVNGANLGGLFGSGLDLSGLPGLPGFPGRQVLMVNSERRLDWSWIIWPVAVVVALPLILSALFVPVFLKSIIIFIQILQSLGLVMPPRELAHHLTSGGSNLTSFN